jgi:hypothetical protein
MATTPTVERPPRPATSEPSAATRRPSAEDLAWLGTIAAAVLLAAAFAWLTPALAGLYPAPNHDVFQIWQGQIAPETHEEIRSMLALGAPIVLAVVVGALGSTRAPRRSFDPLIAGFQVTAIGLLVVAILEQPRRSGFLALDYFDDLLLSPANLIAGAVIGIALTALVLRWRGPLPDRVLRIAAELRRRPWIAVLAAVVAIAIWMLPAVVTDTTINRSGAIAIGHIPLQGEDYFSAVNGRTPLVDYIADYANLLPLVVAPVLGAFNSSITALTAILALLSGLGLLAIFGVFKEVTRGAWRGLALFVPFLALALFPWNDIGPFREFNAIYIGVLPGRYFGPFVLAWLLALSTRRRIPVWALYGWGGLVVLNNSEFGVSAVIALTAAQVAIWDRSTPLAMRLRALAGWGAAGLVGAITLVCAITLIRAGSLPNLTYLTYYSHLFWHDSYGLVPMHSLGLHWALYATYTAAVLIAAVRYVRDDADRTLTAMLAFAGVFGLATAMYFVGRSSQFQLMLLFPAWGLALALVAWTAARSLRSAAGDRERLWRLLLPACAASIGFGVMISAIDRVDSPRGQVQRLESDGPAIYDEVPAQRFIEANTSTGDDVLIVGTAADHRVAEWAGVVNVSPLNGLYTLVSPTEADRTLDALDESGGDEVFETVSAANVPEYGDILRARGFRLVASDPASQLRLWRREG